MSVVCSVSPRTSSCQLSRMHPLEAAAAAAAALQDMPLIEARRRLQLPAFVAAVCDVLHASADAVPSLQPLPADEVNMFVHRMHLCGLGHTGM
jgi:hypothetical protein